MSFKYYLSTVGQGKGTKYSISPAFELIEPIDIEKYYEKEIDERVIKEGFSFSIINDVLAKHSVFNASELVKLSGLQAKFQENLSQLSESEYKKEFDRLAIDLSWKSSQIEENTYSLLETERLLKEKETASGKSKEEATMLNKRTARIVSNAILINEKHCPLSFRQLAAWSFIRFWPMNSPLAGGSVAMIWFPLQLFCRWTGS